MIAASFLLGERNNYVDEQSYGIRQSEQYKAASRPAERSVKVVCAGREYRIR